MITPLVTVQPCNPQFLGEIGQPALSTAGKALVSALADGEVGSVAVGVEGTERPVFAPGVREFGVGGVAPVEVGEDGLQEVVSGAQGMPPGLVGTGCCSGGRAGADRDAWPQPKSNDAQQPPPAIARVQQVAAMLRVRPVTELSETVDHASCQHLHTRL